MRYRFTSYALIAALGLLIVGGITHAEGIDTGPGCSIAWDAPAGPVDGYRVLVGPDAQTMTQRAELPDTAIACADLQLDAGQQYAAVVAFNAAGDSPPSVALPFVLVATAPGSPDNLRILPSPQ